MVPDASSPRHSPKRSPKRKVLHEQSQSQTNKIPKRIGTAEAKREQHFSTPYPTKPAHVLLPSSIRTDQGSSGIHGASFARKVAKGKEKSGGNHHPWGITSSTNAETLGIKRSVSELRDLYESQSTPWPLTIHSTGPSSQPSSAASSPALKGHLLAEKLSEYGRLIQSELDEFTSLPSPRDASCSIKKIASEASSSPPLAEPSDTSSPNESPAEDSGAHGGFVESSSSPNLIVLQSSSSAPDAPSLDPSSPNFVPLGRSSSQDFQTEPYVSSPNTAPFQLTSTPALNPTSFRNPNALELERSSSVPSGEAATSSSPIVFAVGTSSPNYVVTKYDASPDESPDSIRTIKRRRNHIVHEQPSTSTFSTGSEQFNSSPPNRGEFAIYASTSDLHLASGGQSASSSLHQSEGFRAHEDLQAALESSPAPEIQYPVVPAPRMNMWEALNVQKRAHGPLYGDLPSAKWNPHLSTVPSEWSQENPLGSFHTLDTDDSANTNSMPQVPRATYTQDRFLTSSTTSFIPDADRRAVSDMIPDLRGRHLHGKNSGLLCVLSGNSRSNSMRSIILRRPNSNDSLNTVVRFPGWVRRYYSRGPSDAFQFLRPNTSSSTLSEACRPPTTVTPAPQQLPRSLPVPPTRPGKNPRESHLLPGIGPLVSNPSQGRLSSLAVHPADPRAHWAGAEQAALVAELRDGPTVGSRRYNQWSPHLFPDNRASGRARWLAPTIDENGAPIFTWRDVHMLAFMLGFIFPISWFVAAVLPLPPKPTMKEITHDPETGGPTLQQQLEHQIALKDEATYVNLRWWRNLNRFMCIVGLVIIAIIVSYGNSCLKERGMR